MARVELRNVRKVFPGQVEAVKGADLIIHDGEFLVLVGPSGCGKSTLLRLIAGLEELTEGEVHIGDRLVNDVAPKDRDIAMVFQNYALYPHMTVYKNMAFGLKLRKYSKADIDKRVREAAATLGIEDLLERRPKALSGGERQRVAVGRAIVRHPEVFLFDEPLSNLDAKLRIQMRAELSRLHGRLKTTMIYVTHDQVEAMTMGDRIVVLLDGAIQQVAKPMELYAAPANMFVAGFIGSPPMNFFEGVLEGGNGALEFRENDGVFTASIGAERSEVLKGHKGKTVYFGLRPHDLAPLSAPGEESPGTITAKVEVVEPMGSEIFLHLDASGKALTARVGPDVEVGAGEILHLKPDMAKAHFFDGESHVAIR